MFNKPASTENTINTTSPVVTPTPVVSGNPASTTQQPSSKKLLLIVTVVVLVLAAAFGAFAMMQKPPVDQWPEQQPTPTPTATPEPTEEAVFCTMDAKICPDGSSVGRVPPSCEFEACPGEESMTNEEATDSADMELDIELNTDDDSTSSAMKN
jgi:hypothetical protein